MSIVIRQLEAADRAGRCAYVAVVNAVTPENPASLEELDWADRTYPGGVRFLVQDGDTAVGAASVGRIYMYDASFERYWFAIEVLPGARRRGIGSSLWAAVSEVARSAGKTGLQGDVSERHQDGVAFLLHRGFEIVERSKIVSLDLRGVSASPVDPPPGITLTTLAARPDLAAGIHAIAVEAYADIPSEGEPVLAGTLEEFLARDVHRAGIPAEALAIAVDEATGTAVGWASLLFKPGSETAAWHDMTVVAGPWRGRGIATALKRATIAWAVAHGLEDLTTGNDEHNAPMRAVNAKLGYRPLPDLLTVRGPLAPQVGRAGT